MSSSFVSEEQECEALAEAQSNPLWIAFEAFARRRYGKNHSFAAFEDWYESWEAFLEGARVAREDK